MKIILNILLLLFLVNRFILSQYFTISGKVFVKESNDILPFANIRVLNNSFNTASNSEGKYQLILPKGNYILVASYMGYNSDTIFIESATNRNNINFKLSQSEINLAEVVVSPDENPANEIIRKVIKQKKIRNENLKSYLFTGMTKGVIKTNQKFTAEPGAFGIGIDTDSSGIKIDGILENQSNGFFKAPNKYKEIIIARKQTANLPSQVNLLTGGRIIQNFYSDDVKFFNEYFKSPIDDNALNYYNFSLENNLLIDNINVYEISVSLKDSLDPGFTGKIYISEKTFDLLKVDLLLKNFSNAGRIFDSVKIYQHFFNFENFFMPVDYHLIVAIKILTLKLNFELNTILYDYKINNEIADDFFDKAVIKVSTNADDKDSLFWNSTQKISNTSEELEAYSRLDSISQIKYSFWDKFSFLAHPLSITDNFSISGFPAIYHFNKTEGHTFDYSFYFENYFNKRSNSTFSFSYGLSDRKFKYDLNTTLLLRDYRTFKINLNLFDRLNTLFGNVNKQSELFTTLINLFFKNDFSSFYYQKGFSLNLSEEIFPILTLKFGYTHLKDLSAFTNTNFSIFYKDYPYNSNLSVYNSSFNILNFGFEFDFRNYIEDGYQRIRTATRNNVIYFSGDFRYSNNSLLKSDLDFFICELRTNGNINTFKSADFSFSINTFFSNGTLPYQMLNALPGNINWSAKLNTFRTLESNEVVGDRSATIFLEHNFKNEIFRMFKIPFLTKLDLQLKYFLNIAIENISFESKNILSNPVKTFTSPFYETGFSIGFGLIPLELNFGWKLNYKGENNFRIGLSSLIID